MSKDASFYYDFVSPYSYLAFTQLGALRARTGASITFKPINILTVMDQVGNVPTTATCKSKALYARTDLMRWAMQYKTRLKPHPKFGTFSTEPLLLAALSAEEQGILEAFSKAAFEAVWVNQSDLGSDDAIISWLGAAGIGEPEAIWSNRDQYRLKLFANQEAAIRDGVFGVPSFVSQGELYFGNDRLHFLEAGLVE